MKPKILEFKGIKSYSAKTVIDFDKLLSAGLFGIFGKTGSGKSTILDCIFLALYGRVAGNCGSEDFINCRSEDAYVDFTFEITLGGARKTYYVHREYKLKGDRKTAPAAKAVLCEIVDGEKMPVAEKVQTVNDTIQEIIGLSFGDFEKCIVLPQGEFSAFVKMTRADRLRTVSGLFNLEKYGDKLEISIKEKLRALDYDKKVLDEKFALVAEFDKAKLDEETERYAVVVSDGEKGKKVYEKLNEDFLETKTVYDKCVELEKRRKELDDRERLLPEIERRNAMISKYHIAKQVVDLKSERDKIYAQLNDSKRKLEVAENEYSVIAERLSVAREDLKKEPQIREKLENLSAKSVQVDDLEKVAGENVSLSKKLDGLRAELKKQNAVKADKERELEKIENKLSALDADNVLPELEKKILKLFDKLAIDGEKRFVAEETGFLTGLGEMVTGVPKTLVDKRIKELADKIPTDTEGGDEVLKTLNALREEAETVKNARNELLLAKEKYKADISLVDSHIDSITREGTTLKESFDKNAKRIEEVTGGVRIDAFKKQLADKKKILTDELETVIKTEKTFTEKLNEKTLVKSNIEVEINGLKKSFDDTEQKFNDVCQSNFGLYDRAKSIVDTVKDYDKAKEEIEKFYFAFEGAKLNESRLKEELDGKYIDEKTFADKQKELKETQDNYILLKENIIKFEKSLENVSQKYAERCKIDKDLSTLNAELKINERLFNAVKGKKLLEYVAEEYLTEVAVDASKTLSTLIGGKFGLIYDGEFFVEDYTSGAARRRIDMLSGGELFLVSLSLALALAESIYLKSARPMEFFFLDEGFGSLDRELVEVVVDALDKLKNSDFSIGIISHVELLKERMPARVNVIPQDEINGSTLSVI